MSLSLSSTRESNLVNPLPTISSFKAKLPICIQSSRHRERTHTKLRERLMSLERSEHRIVLALFCMLLSVLRSARSTVSNYLVVWVMVCLHSSILRSRDLIHAFNPENTDSCVLVEEMPASRLLRDAKLYEIGAGTSEIRRMVIGRVSCDQTDSKELR